MTPRFRDGPVRVRVPATSANLGPGFDALGLALALHDDARAGVGRSGLAVQVAGEGEQSPRDESHLVVRAMRAAFDRLGGQPPGLELSCANRIPHARGLGSSAAAIVGGIVLARALTDGGDDLLPDPDALALAADLEGHPDNVAAALYGGLTVAWTNAGTAQALRLGCDERIRPVLAVARAQASTAQARAALPETVTHRDAARNAGRAALLVAALTAAPQHLFAGTEDRLHQTYRVPARSATAALLETLRAAGHAAVLSGAGPSVLVLTASDREAARATELIGAAGGWRAERLAVEPRGAHVRAEGARGTRRGPAVLLADE